MVPPRCRHLGLAGLLPGVAKEWTQKGLGNGCSGKWRQPGGCVIPINIFRPCDFLGERLGSSHLGQTELVKEASSCDVTALPPSPADPHCPPPFPPNAISALIKISSSASRGAANSGSRNSIYLLEAVPGAGQVSGEGKQVGVSRPD